MGESEYKKLMLNLARKSSYGSYVLFLSASSFFMFCLGLFLMFFYHDPNADWGFWFAFGIVGYSIVMLVHFSMFGRKLFKEAASASEASIPNSV